MAKLDLLPGGTPAGLGNGFEVAFAGEDGEYRLPLLDAVAVAFETGRPVRSIPSFKSQRHYPGLWWTATTGTLIGYESWLERHTLIGLDFDAEVAGIASQPFWLFWTDDNGKPRSHAPDYFARLADGSARVIDCRPAERIKPRDQAAFDATRAACDLMGWRYEVLDTPPEPLRATCPGWPATGTPATSYPNSRCICAVSGQHTAGDKHQIPPPARGPISFDVDSRLEHQAEHPGAARGCPAAGLRRPPSASRQRGGLR